jgi:hypothetical protein
MKTIKATIDIQNQAAAIKAAKARLERAGWWHTHSVMRSDAQDKEYGLCFVSRDSSGDRARIFYLNRDTINDLPL